MCKRLKINYLQMKNIFLLLFLLPLSVFGQGEDSIKFKKLDLGFTYSPEYSYRMIKASSESQFLAESYDTLEVPKLGYTLGLNGIYTLNKKFALTVGVLFSDKGEKYKKDVFEAFTNYKNHYYYLDIPVKLNYTIIDSKIKFYGTLGVSTNLFLQHRIAYTLSGSSNSDNIRGNSTDISKVNMALNAGLGIDCPLTSRWFFKAEVGYKQSITSMTSNTNLKRYLYNFGPTVGLFYKL